MAQRRGRPVLAGFLVALLAVVVFPWQWVRSYRMAQRHTDEDPRGPAKVAAAIVLGVALAGAGALGLLLAIGSLQAGTYDTLDDDLQTAVREQEYQDAVSTISQKDLQIPIIRGNIENRTADVDAALGSTLAAADAEDLAALRSQWEEQKQRGDELVATVAAGGELRPATSEYDPGGRVEALQANWTAAIGEAGVPEEDAQALEGHMASAVALPLVLAQAHDDRSKAVQRSQALAGHHAFYLSVQDDIETQDDEAVRAAIAGFAVETGETDGIDMDVVDRRFAHKSDVVGDVHGFFLYWPILGWFSLFGLLFAPLVFVQGALLHRVWRPSDTVGYKPYPSFAMGMFLLLGAFNVTAPFFAAWSLADIEGRSLEGQINL